jgi:CHAT domain-containing protein/Tfp pilus assembly protein PilF
MISLEIAKSHVNEAIQLISKGQYNDALALVEQAAPAFEAAEDWEGYVGCLNRLGVIFLNLGRYEGSLTTTKFALEVYNEYIKINSKLLCAIYANIGVIFYQLGNYTTSVEYQQKTLRLRQELLGKWHKDTASSYNNLGGCYWEIGQYADALHCFEQSLKIRLAVLGEQHIDTVSSYNNLGLYYENASNYNQALIYHHKALSINLALLGNLHPKTAYSYNNLGACYLCKSDYKQAAKHYEEALRIRIISLGEKNHSTAYSYNGLGIYYKEVGDYDMAILYHQKALSIWHKDPEKPDPKAASIYLGLGNCYRLKGNYERAIYYHQVSLAIKYSFLPPIHRDIAKSYINIALCLWNIKQYDQSIVQLEKALTIQKQVLGYEINADKAGTYNNMAVVFRLQGKYTYGIQYAQKSLDIRLHILGKCHNDTSNTYYNIGLIYAKKNEFEKALHHYQKALQSLALNVPDEDYYPLPKLEVHNSAIDLLDLLSAKANTFQSLYHQSQTPQDLTAALAHYQCADALIDQMRQSYKTEGSKLLLAEKGKTKVYDAGLAALFDYQLLVKNTSNNMLTLSHFNQTLGYQLPDRPIDLAFHFSEKSKAVLLFAGMKDAEARLNAQLPPDLVQQEYDLRVELTYLERRISEEGYKKDEEQDKTALNEWQSQHFDFKNQYDALIERLETEYPKYYQLKYDLQAANIAQVQTALPPNKAMISYVLADKYLYTIIITAQQSYWLQTDLPTDFEGLVEDFLLSFQSKIGIRDYITYGYDLYRHLILPALNTGALQNIQQFIIIPDGILSRVPFEALLTADCTDKTPLQDLPYLLQQYQIAYHYSATLWLNQQTATSTQEPENANENAPSSGEIGGGKDFIGFAPIYSNTAQNSSEHDIDLTLPDDFYEKIGIEKPEEKHRINYTETADVVRSVVEGRNFVELIHSETEVRNVAELFAAKRQTAKLLLHEKATLDNFKALVGKYRYILVSAHADYNGEKPDQTGIIFSPNETDGNGIFYMGDAYNLQLQADLVVLSCCETGLGKISKGEGTMALNRGFLYSGAKNVVYTLFKVYDKESCELSTELFRQLIAQKPNAEALHQAKLSLIARGLMPIKWAGYVLVGQ